MEPKLLDVTIARHNKLPESEIENQYIKTIYYYMFSLPVAINVFSSVVRRFTFAYVTCWWILNWWSYKTTSVAQGLGCSYTLQPQCGSKTSWRSSLCTGYNFSLIKNRPDYGKCNLQSSLHQYPVNIIQRWSFILASSHNTAGTGLPSFDGLSSIIVTFTQFNKWELSGN